MFKKTIVCGLIILFIAVAISPINATDYKGHTVNVNGFDFNMINGYEEDYESSDCVSGWAHRSFGSNLYQPQNSVE